MWTRKELKTKAKNAFKNNYWKAVAVCFIIAVFTSSYNSSTTVITQYDSKENTLINETNKITNSDIVKYIADIDLNKGLEKAVNDISYEESPILRGIGSIYMMATGESLKTSIILLTSGILTILIYIFVQNILLIGEASFFIKNSNNKKPTIKNILDGFYNNYMLNVITMLKRTIYFVLWSLTLIAIPIKFYQYKMIPFILAENPKLKSGEIITLSKKIMKGNKWKAFVLDLSFIWWAILTVITLGVVGIFFVNPYKASTNAELYKKIKKA